MSLRQAKPEHEVAYQDLIALVRKHADVVSSVELLAIASNMVGKLVAMQDHRQVTPEMAMEIVAKNVQHGNQEVVNEVAETIGNA